MVRGVLGMIKSSTRIAIPLMSGVRGCIDQYPFTPDGSKLKPIHWLTPMEIQYPDGWAIFKLKTVPTLMLYEGKKEFEIWDEYMMSKPRFVGRVKIDCDTHQYEVELEQRYHCFRLTMLLLAHHQPQEPFESIAYQNNTPYGEWVYKDTV